LKRDLGRLTILDVLLIAALLALPGWALIRSARAAGERPIARIFQNNRLVGTYELDRDQMISIGDRARPDMSIEIRGGAIRVAESDCPKGVCIHAGWVRTPGRSILCIPNRVLIEIKGESKDYDAESY
jgi:hypothetical protein